MNWNELQKKLLPHVLIVLIFIAACFIYMGPILKGKSLPQNDVKQWMGSFEEARQFNDKTGETTLWTNSMFGGMPTYQISPHSQYSLIGIKYIYGVLVSGFSLPKPINSLFLYCFGFYLLLLAFGVNRWLSMIGALAYAFSTFNIVLIEAGHMLQTYALGSGPMVLAAAAYTLRSRKYILGGSLFAVALAINVRINHPQISYYLALVLLIYLLSELIYHFREKQLASYFKAAGVFFIGLILAVGSTATFLITSSEYAKETIRGKTELSQAPEKASGGLDRDYAFDWSYGKGETFSILIPDFMGGGSGSIAEHNKSALASVEDPQVREIVSQLDQYWGGQPFTSGPFYFGAIICFLFVLGLFFLKGRDKWWLLGVAVFSIMLSWGKYFDTFNYFMFNNFPLYNKFRSVQFTLLMSAIVFPLMAMLALNEMFQKKKLAAGERKKFLYALVVAGGLCLIFYIVPSTAGDFQKPGNERTKYESADKVELEQSRGVLKQYGTTPEAVLDGLVEAREHIMRSDAGRSLILILLAAGLLYLFLIGKLKQQYVLAGIGILVVFDLVGVDLRYLDYKTFKNKNQGADRFIATDADNKVLEDKDQNYRVLNLYNVYQQRANDVFNDATTSYFHKSIGGYHGAKLRRFQELREHYLDRQVGMLEENINQMPPMVLLNTMQQRADLGLLNMLNMKYVIAGPRDSDVVRNPYALGNAWFVKGIRMVPNADAEIGAINHFNPADTAVIDNRFSKYLEGFRPDQDANGSIKLISYKPNDLVYESQASAEQLAVFSEVYYNDKLGWHATVDGAPAEHIRANYLIRAMRVPAGKHTIEFRFQPHSFEVGEHITLASSLLLLLGFLGGVGYEVYRNRKKKEAQLS